MTNIYSWEHQDMNGKVIHSGSVESDKLKTAKRMATQASVRAFLGNGDDREKKNIWQYMDWEIKSYHTWIKKCKTKWGSANPYLGHTLTLKVQNQ